MDPPYNTESAGSDGNNFSEKDKVSASKFIYRDKFSRNGWLNMMNERLKLAHQLLKDDGVIFVSIDDTEQAYLKILMDEIFGEENFITTFIIDKTAQGANQSKTFKLQHEYLLCYCKNNQKVALNYEIKVEWDEKKYKYTDNQGYYAITNAFDSINSPLAKNKNRGYTIYFNELTKDVIIRDEYDKNKEAFCNYDKILIQNGYTPIRPEIRNNIQYPWNWEKERFLMEYKTELEFVKNQKGKLHVYHKNRFNGFVKDTSLKTFDTRKYGNKILNDILEKKTFNYPKSIQLIKWLLTKHKNKNARVLDFFAGSGTTGHAVLDLNKEDGGNRTYTIVTNNENNIGIDACYERLYRINNGEGTKKEKDFKWIEENESYKQNLDVFKIEYFNTEIFTGENNKIKNTFIQELKDFNISKPDDYYTKNNKELLLNLTSLKPQEEDN
ncbi:site-specific DNA-methyltransferase [Mycoplasmopsis hyopharyngis]|uniref:site-specific DNA-methyltransferase n=1 Tax=Mycoplasmopsis hyopharyngis TaxID=29558 RepID=UPI003872C54E